VERKIVEMAADVTYQVVGKTVLAKQFAQSVLRHPRVGLY
jgi:hypothetical protein